LVNVAAFASGPLKRIYHSTFLNFLLEPQGHVSLRPILGGEWFGKGTVGGERYLALAKAQAQSGDMIGAENYYQHAEHYFRSMSSDRGTT
jgi:Domain of unknown function (DUF4167)